jgi:FkbH-like protein
MNMTTRRYTEAQIRDLARDPSAAVFSVAAADRFGDQGIIGVFILKFLDDECRIDSFLLSCRVIGRGIEKTMLAFIADLARSRGMRRIVGEFIPTAKNRPAAGFFERAGMAKVADRLFAADLSEQVFAYPPTIRLAVQGKAAR